MPQKLLQVLLGTMAVGALLLLMFGAESPPKAIAELQTYASPVHAGCYLASPTRCKIHVEPFTINLSPGQRLVRFRLMAMQVSTGIQTMIYDFRPDLSNPLPVSGSTVTPSLVAKDFAATCGQTYSINLQGQGTGDANLLSLGSTGQFTCPNGTFRQYLPLLAK